MCYFVVRVSLHQDFLKLLIAKNDLELLVLLPSSPLCWDPRFHSPTLYPLHTGYEPCKLSATIGCVHARVKPARPEA